jgi:hypothetical protein
MTATRPWRRLPLRRSDARGRLERLAGLKYWRFTEVVKRTDDRPFELVWVTEDEKVSIHYIEDFVLGLSYVLLRGPGLDDVADLISDEVETVPPDEVLDRGRKAESAADMVKAAYLVAAGASSEFDREAFAILERAMEHSDPEARKAGAVASGYVEWRQCRKPLAHLAMEDPDDEVKRTAKTVLDGLGD